MLATLLLSLATLAPAGGDKALPSKARLELRALLAEALAEPDAKERAGIAARAEAFAREYRPADLFAALAEGPLLDETALEPRRVAGEIEELARFERTTVGYSFESGGARYRYAVDLPERYDPARPCGLLLDPGHGSAQGAPDRTRAEMLGMYRRHADAAGLSDWIVARTEIVEQIGAGGARGAKPDDEVALVFQDFFRALAARFAVDPDRIVVTGISQTGYWSWYLGRFRADRFAALQPMSAISRVPVDAYASNFLALPVQVLHGDADPTCDVGQVRSTAALLARLGAPLVYREIQGGAHDYAVWKHQPEGLRELARKPRDPHPRRISKSLSTELDGWCYWLRVEGITKSGDGRASSPPAAGIDAELDAQRIQLFSEGVERVTLCLSPRMLDLEQPLEVLWNEKRVHAGAVQRDFPRAFATAAEKADWKTGFEAFLELQP